MQDQLDLKVKIVTDNIIDLPKLSSIELGEGAFYGYAMGFRELKDLWFMGSSGFNWRDNVLVMKSIGLRRNVS